MLSESPTEKLLESIQKWYNNHNAYHQNNLLNVFQANNKVVHDLTNKVYDMIISSHANIEPFVPGFNRMLLITQNVNLVNNFRGLNNFEEIDLKKFDPSYENISQDDAAIYFCQLKQVDIVIFYVKQINESSVKIIKNLPRYFDMILIDSILDDKMGEDLLDRYYDIIRGLSNTCIVFSNQRYVRAKNFLTFEGKIKVNS